MTIHFETKRSTRLFVGCLLLTLVMNGCVTPGSDSGSGDDAASNDAVDELSLDGESIASAPSSDDGESDELDLDEAEPQSEAAVGDDDSLTAELASEELSDGKPAAVTTAPPQPAKSQPELQPEPQVAQAEPELTLDEPEPPPITPQPVAKVEPPVGHQPAAVRESHSHEIKVTDLRYLSGQNGGSVVIETSAPATFNTREVNAQNQVVVEIANAHLPARLKRPYVTKDFGQPITSINAYQDQGSTTVRVVIQFKAPTRANVQQTGKKLMVAASGSPSLDLASAHEEGDGTIVAANTMESVGRGLDAEDPRILPATSSDFAYDTTKFYGRPISLEVRDTPVKEVINLIAEQSGANIVLADDDDSKISLKLRQIPWDQALLIVMKAKNLGYVRQGSILRIAPYKKLQEETEAARKVVDARRDAEPLRVKVIPVGYAKVADLEKQIDKFLSPARGKVVADQRTNALVVTDTPDVLERISNLVKALDLPPLQVLIEGKVVEAREAFNRDFGISWNAGGGDGVDLGGGKFLNQNLNVRGVGNIPAAGANIGLQLGTLDFLGDLNATLGLLEREDIVKIVSSPRIVALNNEQASILQGSNIPSRRQSVTGSTTTISYEYIPVEMKLEVTPQVTSENDIILNLSIKRDFATNRLADVPPDVNKREAKTKVMVRNGQTAVVGGVYQSDSSESEGGVPWLRSIPVLGWLFKNRSVNNEKNELLVFLTPRILNAEKSLQKENNL